MKANDSNSTYIASAFIASAIILLLIVQMCRYKVVSAGDGRAYRLDRLTGNTQFMRGYYIYDTRIDETALK